MDFLNQGINRVKSMAMELKAKITAIKRAMNFLDSGEEFISFEQAVAILKTELKYPEGRALHFVKMFDHNKDGRLSATEFVHFKNKIEETKFNILPKFKEYDRDNNGYITLEEASFILQNPPFNFPPGKVIMLLKKFDKDGNGKLDIEEFSDFYAETKATNEEITSRFLELDKDGNGVLSPDEVVSVIKEMMGYTDQMAYSLMQVFDKNQDGSLDKTEFMQLWSNMFGPR